MNIAIAGYGIEGRANYDYWNMESNELTIVDERDSLDDLPEGAKTILGAGAFGKLKEFDMVLRTAGLSPSKIQTDGIIWTSTNEFFAKCPAKIIGVTGTKGKGTTSSLISAMLREAGKTVHLVGNIGLAALTVLDTIQPDDIVVFEMSSFQLWDLDKSPNVAVITPIHADHLDVHENFDDYVAAKANIVRFQSDQDTVIANADNETAQSIALTSFATQLSYPTSNAGHVVNEKFFVGETEVCNIAELKIPGKHNIENTCAALTAAWQYSQDVAAMTRAIATFKGLLHRLQFVAEKNGVDYFDDSIATTPESAIAAISSFKAPRIVILGGHDKGADYRDLILVCKDERVTVIAIGSNREKINGLCVAHNVKCIVESGRMPAIVRRSSIEAKPGSVVILSPSAASFDMFKSYADRGDQFADAVNSL